MEVGQCLACWTMVDHIPHREQGKGIKLLEDGIARLMDGHDHNPVTGTAQSAQINTSSGLVVSGTQLQFHSQYIMQEKIVL